MTLPQDRFTLLPLGPWESSTIIIMIDPSTTLAAGGSIVATKVAPAVTNAAIRFVGRICNPAAEELGLLLRDNVAAMRQRNAVKLLEKAEQLLNEDPARVDARCPPRLVHKILDEGSWIDEDHLRDLWAGLLASACTPGGDDDSNVLFVNLLEDLTGLQAKILSFACERSIKRVDAAGLIAAGELSASPQVLQEVAGCSDIDRLDREMDCLRAIGLLDDGGFRMGDRTRRAYLTPTALAIHLWCRCQGSREAPAAYLKLGSTESVSSLSDARYFKELGQEPVLPGEDD